MGLFEEPEVGDFGEFVSDGGGSDPELVFGSNEVARDGLGGDDVFDDDGAENRFLSFAEFVHHVELRQESGQC